MPVSDLLGFKTTLMFDFDNTLLLMDEEKFIKTYFSLVAKRFEKEFELEEFFDHMSKSILSMTLNSKQNINNIEKFLRDFQNRTNLNREVIISRFDEFYKNEFNLVKNVTKPHPYAEKIIKKALERGYNIIIASNPLYPEIVAELRLGWAGLEQFKDEIRLFTTGENMHFTKPDINYYKEILQLIDERPENCLMIGNDYINDGIASLIGIDIFLLERIEFTNSPHFLDEESKKLVGNKKIEIKHTGTLKNLYKSL